MRDLDENISVKFSNMAFVSALMVVSIHSCSSTAQGSSAWWLNQILGRGICSAAVPFFFLSAGFFVAREFSHSNWWWMAILKRLKSLGFPYLFWSVLFCAELLILRVVQAGSHGGTYRFPLDFPTLGETLGTDFFRMPVLYPLWFVRALFVMIVALPVAELLTRRKVTACIGVVGCLTVIVVMVILRGDVWEPFRSTFSIEGFMYFLTGVAVRRLNVHFKWKKRYGVLIGVVVMFVTLLVALVRLMDEALVPWSAYVIAPMALMAFWTFVPTTRFYAFLLDATFPMFLLHPFVLAVSNIVIFWISKRIGISVEGSAVVGLVRWSIAVIVSIAVTHFLFRFPRMASVVFGGRVPMKIGCG